MDTYYLSAFSTLLTTWQEISVLVVFKAAIKYNINENVVCKTKKRCLHKMSSIKIGLFKLWIVTLELFLLQTQYDILRLRERIFHLYTSSKTHKSVSLQLCGMYQNISILQMMCSMIVAKYEYKCFPLIVVIIWLYIWNLYYWDTNVVYQAKPLIYLQNYWTYNSKRYSTNKGIHVTNFFEEICLRYI